MLSASINSHNQCAVSLPKQQSRGESYLPPGPSLLPIPPLPPTPVSPRTRGADFIWAAPPRLPFARKCHRYSNASAASYSSHPVLVGKYLTAQAWKGNVQADISRLKLRRTPTVTTFLHPQPSSFHNHFHPHLALPGSPG